VFGHNYSICQPVFSPLTVSITFQDCRGFDVPAVYRYLKKSCADRAYPANYRLISSLSTTSKVLERLTLTQLRAHVCLVLQTSAHFNPDSVPATPWKRRFSSCLTRLEMTGASLPLLACTFPPRLIRSVTASYCLHRLQAESV